MLANANCSLLLRQFSTLMAVPLEFYRKPVLGKGIELYGATLGVSSMMTRKSAGILVVGIGCGAILANFLNPFSGPPFASQQTPSLAQVSQLVSPAAVSGESRRSSSDLPVGQMPDAPLGYRKVVENKKRTIQVTVNKLQPESKQKEVEYTVCRPVYETHQKVVRYTVARYVNELRSKVVNYTVVVPGEEPRQGSDASTVTKPVTETRSKVVNYTVRVPVFEKREKVVDYTTCKMVQEKRVKTVNYTVNKRVKETEERVVDYVVVRYEPIESEDTDVTMPVPGC